RTAEHHGELGNAAIADGVHQLGAGLDDAILLAVAADHKAVNVLQKYDRQPLLVAGHHKPGGLVGAIDIDHAAKLDRPLGRPHLAMLVGDDADRKSADAGLPTDQRLPIFGLVFIPTASIDQAGYQVPHVVLFAAIDRNK